MAGAENQGAPVYLIDASIYIFQSHFSPYVESYNSRGEELSALFGFVQFVLQFLRRLRPTHVALAHDESLFCGFRHSLCPNYKSNRELPDDNLAWQLRGCLELGEALGIASFSSQTYEADDIIGTLTRRINTEQEKQDGQVAVNIVSRDKDLAQLLGGDHDCLWDYSGNRKRYREDIIAELGIRPEQIPDYLGLVGDSVDCITGVPGVGPVKARELLQRYGTLESVYEHLDEVATLPLRGARGLAEKLREHQELAVLSKLLATIVCELPEAGEAFASTELDSLHYAPNGVDSLAAFLREYHFRPDQLQQLLRLAERLG